MKINKVDVLGYGKWHDISFDFNQSNLQVIFGNNEAGKTTLLSLIEGILFGFVDGRTGSYEQYKPRETKAYGGKLTITTEDNRHFIITRLDGKNGGDVSIYDVDNDIETAPDILDKLLGPIDRSTFEQLFYFGDLDIKSISKLSKDELVNRIQRVGFVGSDQWLELRDKIEKTSKELYAPTGRKPELNQKLKEYDALVEKVQLSKGNLDKYNQLIEEKNLISNKIDQQKAELQKTDKELNNLMHLRQVWPVYSKLSQINTSNEPIRNGFDEEDVSKLKELENALFLSSEQIKNIDESIKRLTVKKENNSELEIYNCNRNQIDQLSQSFSKVNEMINDLKIKKSMIDEINHQNEQKSVVSEDELSRVQNQLDEFNGSNSKKDNSSLMTFLPWILVGVLAVIALIIPMTFSRLIGGLLVVILGLAGFMKSKSKNNNDLSVLESQLSDYATRNGITLNDLQGWINEQRYFINHPNNNQVIQYENDYENISKDLSDYFKHWKEYLTDLNAEDQFTFQLDKVRTFVSKMNEENSVNIRNNEQMNEQLTQKSQLVDKQTSIKNSINEFLRSRNVDNLDSFKEAAEKQKQLKLNKEQRDSIKDQITDADIALLKQYKDNSELDDKIDKFKNNSDVLKNEILSQSQSFETVNFNIKKYISDGTYSELIQQQSNLESEINDLTDEWLSMKLADEWIDESLNIATADRIPSFEKKAAEFFTLLTDNEYVGIKYLKKNIKVTRNDKEQFAAGELSRGTVEQLYLSMILALSVVFGRDYHIPMIIDDGLTEFDFERTQNAINLLKNISDSIQVIYVTCDNRIQEYVNEEYILNLNNR